MSPQYITDIGDSAVLTGIILSGIAYLWLCHCRKGACALVLSLLCTSLLISAAKLFFLGCKGYLYITYDIYSPSGHTALSVAVFGSYALLISSQLSGLWRFVPALLAVPLVAAIAVTRLLLRLHSLPEVVAGLIIGLCALLPVHLFLKTGRPASDFNVYALTASAILAALVLHGTHFPAEELIRAMAAYVKNHVPVCNRA